MKQKILVLAPHTDDGELGCGGTIIKHMEEGAEIHIAVFSSCQQSVPNGYPADILKTEFKMSMADIGVPEKQQYLMDYPVRHFPEFRQDILDEMIVLGRNICPDIVMIPSPHDIHQDHSTVANEAMRAFKKTCILGYELPWNNYTFNNQTFSVIEAHHVEKKIHALQHYKTQQMRNYFQPEYQWAIVRTHGAQINVQYAEVFETIRWIM